VQACYGLTVDKKSKLVYVCCADGTVVIIDLVSMKEVARLPCHSSDGVSCADLSRDGLTLWTGGLDSTLRSWDFRQRRELSKANCAAQIFSLGCTPTDDWVAVGLDSSQIEVMSTLPNATDRYQLRGHKACILSLRYAHSGKWFCTADKGNIVNAWRAPYGPVSAQRTEAGSVLCCDISADDSMIVTGSGKHKATVYKV
ncbi:hypothetical protein PENTCL1PPCAC_21172, partial [Pristionchus entomophagus]